MATHSQLNDLLFFWFIKRTGQKNVGVGDNVHFDNCTTH